MTTTAERQSVFVKQQPMITLSDLLADYDDGNGTTTQKYFRIPIYQRGYAWGVRQCYELWEDIRRVKENPAAIHFVGTLSLQRNKEFDNRDSNILNTLVYDVVDGQQRFTTLMIILRLLLEKVDNNKWPIDSYIGDKKGTRKFQYTVTNIASRDYLEERLYRLNQQKAANFNAYFVNIARAIEYFGEDEGYDKDFKKIADRTIAKDKVSYRGCGINTMSEQEAEKYIETILKNLLFSLNFFDDSSNIKYDVHTVFEAMNNRGKPPTKLEILKNRLMYLSQDHNVKNKIELTWGIIYASLGARSFAVLNDDDFLKSHWYMYHGQLRRKDSEEPIRQIFDDCFALEKFNKQGIQQEIEEYLDSLRDSIYTWQYLNVPDSSTAVNVPTTNITSGNTSEIIKKLSRLVKYNSYPYWKSFLLSILCANNLPQSKLDELLNTIEKYGFIIGYLNGDQKKAFGSSSWATLANEVYKAKANQSELETIINKVITEKTREIVDNLSHALDEFYQIRDNVKIKAYYDWPGQRYFLFEYDLEIMSRNRNQSVTSTVLDWYDWDTVEHILPQKPKHPYWQTAFAPYIQDSNAMRILTHSLGNFLPIDGSNNSSLGNSDYPTKRDGEPNSKKFAYKRGCASAFDVADRYRQHWTATEIYTRIDDMSQFMFNTWIKPYATAAGLNITASDIADRLKLDNPSTPVPPQTDSTLIANLDQLLQTQAQMQAQAAATVKIKRGRNLQNAANAIYYDSLKQELEQLLSTKGFVFDATSSYLWIYLPDWHKRGKRCVHYDIWGQNFALMCEGKTPESVVQSISQDRILGPIFSDFYSEYSGKYGDNRVDLTGWTDIKSKAAAIASLINNTWTSVDQHF